MDDRSTPSTAAEHLAPVNANRHGTHAGDTPGGASPLGDPRALTILTTEHWSLLSARSLVYNEAFARAGMFLSFLAATLVALGLMSGAMGFDHEFLTISALVLGLDLFIGLATMGRVSTATSEDIRYLQAMNRIRHAYHEAVPGLEVYFVSGHHDDIAGVFGAYGADVRARTRRNVLHGFTTVIGTLGVINAALTGVLIATLALLTLGGNIALAAGVAGYLVVQGISILWMTQSVAQTVGRLEAKFPTPPEGDRPGD